MRRSEATATDIRYFNGDCVVKAELALQQLPQRSIREAVAQAIVANGHSGGSLVPKFGVNTQGGGRFHSMPALLGPYAGMKWVCVGEKPAPGEPYIHALFILSDVATGRTLALMEAGAITGSRTAAVTALAAQACCDPDLNSIAILGCGLQARTHLTALCDLFPLHRAVVRGRSRQTLDLFMRHADALGVAVEMADSPQALAAAAPLLLLATPLSIPDADRIAPEWINPGGFVAALDHGAALRGHGAHGFDCILTDDAAHHWCTIESGLMPAVPRIDGDLSGLLSKSCPRGTGPDGRTLFVPPGIALADLAVAALLYERGNTPHSGSGGVEC